MSNLSKKDYKKFGKKANRRKEHQEIDTIKRLVRSSARKPRQLWQDWENLSPRSLLNMLEDYKIDRIEQNFNWDEEEIIVRFCKSTSVPRINLEHWF